MGASHVGELLILFTSVYAIAGSEPFECVRVTELCAWIFHQEVYRTSVLSAHEAVEKVLRGVYLEMPQMLPHMERTGARELHRPTLLQRAKLANHVLDVRRFFDFQFNKTLYHVIISV